MFVGSVPDALLSQVLKSVDFKAWPAVNIICSGSFKLERAIRIVAPEATIHGNDVALLSCAIGRVATGEPLPFTFTGDLAWFEELLRDELAERTAAVLIARELAPFSIGAATVYKTRHIDHIRRSFPAMLAAATGKLELMRKQLVIDGFLAADFRDQIAAAVELGAGVVGFPPLDRSGEQLFKFVDANTEWDRPAAPPFDPADLGELIDGIEAAGLPFCILADRKLEDREPVIEYRPGRNAPIYGYASDGLPSFRRGGEVRSTPFDYKSIDVSQIGPDTQVELVVTDTGRAAFVKDVYLAKNIQHVNGEVNMLVYLDGMLAGLIVFSRSRVQVYHGNEIYLLSDLSTSRDGRLSKLIASLTTCSEIIRFLERHYLRRFEYVVTTAFARGPVSMKYRGVFDLLKRSETAAFR